MLNDEITNNSKLSPSPIIKVYSYHHHHHHHDHHHHDHHHHHHHQSSVIINHQSSIINQNHYQSSSMIFVQSLQFPHLHDACIRLRPQIRASRINFTKYWCDASQAWTKTSSGGFLMVPNVGPWGGYNRLGLKSSYQEMKCGKFKRVHS